MCGHAGAFPEVSRLAAAATYWTRDQCLHILADRYQVVTLTGGQVVRGLTYLKAAIKHVVVDDAGRPYHPDTLSDFWRELCGAAKVRQIRLHDARHSCASIMHAQGVPIAIISAWSGHADPAFTMRT